MERKKRNHNEGSIRERADGRFEIRVTAGYDFEIGKPKRISYYAKTKAEAIQKLHEEEYKIHFQKHVDPTSTTFLDWLQAEHTGTFAQNHSESSPLPAQGNESGSAGTLHRFQPL